MRAPSGPGRAAAVALLAALSACGDPSPPASPATTAAAPPAEVIAFAGADDRFAVVLAPVRGSAAGDAWLANEMSRALGVAGESVFDLHVYRVDARPAKSTTEPAPADRVPAAVAPLELRVVTKTGPAPVTDPAVAAASRSFRTLKDFRAARLAPGEGFTAHVALGGRIALADVVSIAVDVGGKTIALERRTVARALFDDLVESPSRATLVAFVESNPPADAPEDDPPADDDGDEEDR